MKGYVNLGNRHCDRCQGLGAAVKPPAERNLELETFVVGWAKDNGFAFTLTNGKTFDLAKPNA